MRYVLDLATRGELYVDTTFVSAVEVVEIVNIEKTKDDAFNRFGINAVNEKETHQRPGMVVHIDGEKFTCEYDAEFLDEWMSESEGPIH
jgi:hypothetical protein